MPSMSDAGTRMGTTLRTGWRQSAVFWPSSTESGALMTCAREKRGAPSPGVLRSMVKTRAATHWMARSNGEEREV